MQKSGLFETSGKIVDDAPRVYIDTMILIYAFENHTDEFGSRARRLLESAARNELTAFTSELTLAEVLVNPGRRRQHDLVRSYLALFNGRGFLRMHPVTRAILSESAEYRSRVHPDKPGPTEDKRNFLADAIHVVTGIAVEATYYVASDKRIRLPVGMIRLDPRRPEFDSVLDAFA